MTTVIYKNSSYQLQANTGSKFTTVLVVSILALGVAISGLVIESIRMKRINNIIKEECGADKVCRKQYDTPKSLLNAQLVLWIIIVLLVLILIGMLYSLYGSLRRSVNCI